MSRLHAPSSRGVHPEGPRNDAYTAMLLVAVLALLLGTVLLGLEQYEFYGKLFGLAVDDQKAAGSRYKDADLKWKAKTENGPEEGGGDDDGGGGDGGGGDDGGGGGDDDGGWG